ncbi:MAG: helix-turn-helix domain-containing protein [Actinomycetota bacterium]
MKSDKKLLYIGEVERLTGIPRWRLRYLERKYRLIVPKRRGKGWRKYKRKHVSWILKLKKARQEGLSYSQIKQLIKTGAFWREDQILDVKKQRKMTKQ